RSRLCSLFTLAFAAFVVGMVLAFGGAALAMLALAVMLAVVLLGAQGVRRRARIVRIHDKVAVAQMRLQGVPGDPDLHPGMLLRVRSVTEIGRASCRERVWVR